MGGRAGIFGVEWGEMDGGEWEWAVALADLTPSPWNTPHLR